LRSITSLRSGWMIRRGRSRSRERAWPKDIRCNTHLGIIDDFQEHFGKDEAFAEYSNFSTLVMQINKNQPVQKFAENYLESAKRFLYKVIEERNIQLRGSEDKLVIEKFYKA